MAKKTFVHSSRGKGRPQILLIGNGLEHESHQPSWDELVKKLKVDGAPELTKKEREQYPFPLLYEVLSTPAGAPAHLSAEDLKAEEDRLAEVMKGLNHSSNCNLDQLPSIGADHIMTTNYSYCLETAFYPGRDFSKPHVRNRIRFSCGEKRENHYRLHTGYLAGETGLWHIHGEAGATRSVVLGHDRYGRLLGKIVEICGAQTYDEEPTKKEFTSWPELFLYGDVYVLGFSFAACEFDLWWLLRRKQRERYSDGQVYFYERPEAAGYTKPEHFLLRANGAVILDAGMKPGCDYNAFYAAAIKDIQKRIEESRR